MAAAQIAYIQTDPIARADDTYPRRTTQYAAIGS
jgi:hypothetical protein